MDIEKEREAFVKWFESRYIDDIHPDSTIGIVSWEAWQAQKAQAVPEQVLDAPACVGGGTFQKGVKWSTVIGAAQRHYENDGHHERPAISIADQLRVASGHSVVVPREPTEIMAFRGESVLFDVFAEDAVRIYKAMIEAAQEQN